MKNIIKLFLSLLFILGCNDLQIKKNEPIYFAVIGNTHPHSPFIEFPEIVSNLVSDINISSPLFVIHMGNMIFGGYDWMGINSRDIENQYKKSVSIFSKLNSPMYVLIGEKDYFNDSDKYFKIFSRFGTNFSFNYSNSHFILLDIINKKNIDNSMKWLKKDLTNSKAGVNFIFVNRSIIEMKKKEFVVLNRKLHNLFKNESVRAVFSHQKGKSFQKIVDGVEYISLPEYGIEKEIKYRKRENVKYYLIDYINGKININLKTIEMK